MISMIGGQLLLLCLWRMEEEVGAPSEEVAEVGTFHLKFVSCGVTFVQHIV